MVLRHGGSRLSISTSRAVARSGIADERGQGRRRHHRQPGVGARHSPHRRLRGQPADHRSCQHRAAPARRARRGRHRSSFSDARVFRHSPARGGGLERSGKLGEARFPRVEYLDMPVSTSTGDSVEAARRMRAAGVAAIIVLGGDGTHRAVVSACGDIPITGVSTRVNRDTHSNKKISPTTRDPNPTPQIHPSSASSTQQQPLSCS